MEFYPPKSLYLIFIFGIYLFLAYSLIPTLPSLSTVESVLKAVIAPTVLFYIVLMLIGEPLFIVDLFTEKKFEQIETVTVDDPEDSLLEETIGISLSIPNQLLIGLFISALLAFAILQNGFGVVGVPEFFVFSAVFGNALLSALAGFVEDRTILGIVGPTIRKNFEGALGSRFFASMIAVFLGSLFFMAYHSWRYGFNQLALASTFTFSLLSLFFIEFTNSTIISHMLHGTNNGLVSLALAKNIALAIAV